MLALIWGIYILNVAADRRLCVLGIYPRSLFGIPGIAFTPFIHADFNHVFFNSIPLFVLANLILVSGQQVFFHVTLLIILISGGLIWLFARPALHVGASALIMGYWSYLLVQSYQHPTTMSIILAIITLYYFGGLFMSIFPREKHVSWEGHLFGMIAGFVVAFIS